MSSLVTLEFMKTMKTLKGVMINFSLSTSLPSLCPPPPPITIIETREVFKTKHDRFMFFNTLQPLSRTWSPFFALSLSPSLFLLRLWSTHQTMCVAFCGGMSFMLMARAQVPVISCITPDCHHHPYRYIHTCAVKPTLISFFF